MKLYCALNEFEIRIGILWLLVFIYSIIVSTFPVLSVKRGGGVSKLVWNADLIEDLFCYYQERLELGDEQITKLYQVLNVPERGSQ